MRTQLVSAIGGKEVRVVVLDEFVCLSVLPQHKGPRGMEVLARCPGLDPRWPHGQVAEFDLVNDGGNDGIVGVVKGCVV